MCRVLLEPHGDFGMWSVGLRRLASLNPSLPSPECSCALQLCWFPAAAALSVFLAVKGSLDLTTDLSPLPEG